VSEIFTLFSVYQEKGDNNQQLAIMAYLLLARIALPQGYMKATFALIALLFAGQAYAGPTWTVTTSGKIASGQDNAGLFGTLGRDLTGLNYTQTLIASIDPADWPFYYESEVYASYQGSYGPNSQGTVTIDGNSFSFEMVQASYSSQFISNGVTYNSRTGGSSDYEDRIQSRNVGNLANSKNLFVQNVVYTYAPASKFVSTLDFTQAVTQKVTADYVAQAFFSYNLGETRFIGAPEILIVNGRSSSDIPEPTSFALLAIGAISIAVASNLNRMKL
jgi:hypothetical protein